MMELPSFRRPQIRSFASHSITKATKDLLIVLLGNGCALWCIFVMHPTGVKEDGQHDLDIAADLPCFFDLGDDGCFHCEDCIFVSGSYP